LNTQNKQLPAKFLIVLAILGATFIDVCLSVQNYIVSLGHVYVSAAIFFYPFLCLILDIISEIYGYQIAKYALCIIMLSDFMFGLFTTLVTELPAPNFWSAYTKSFDASMVSNLRLALIGVITITIGQYMNIYFVSKLKILTRGRYFALRSMTSTIVGDTFTIVVALFAFFDHRMSNVNIATIIIAELLMMYLSAAILAYPGSIITYYLKKVVQPYTDTRIDFNPFRNCGSDSEKIAT